MPQFYLFIFLVCALGSGLWMVSCPSGPSGCGSVDPIVFCINTRGLVHKGHLVSSLESTAGMKSSHHSPFAHICSVVRQGRGLSLGDWRTGVQFAPQGTRSNRLNWTLLNSPLCKGDRLRSFHFGSSFNAIACMFIVFCLWNCILLCLRCADGLYCWMWALWWCILAIAYLSLTVVSWSCL